MNRIIERCWREIRNVIYDDPWGKLILEVKQDFSWGLKILAFPNSLHFCSPWNVVRLERIPKPKGYNTAPSAFRPLYLLDPSGKEGFGEDWWTPNIAAGDLSPQQKASESCQCTFFEHSIRIWRTPLCRTTGPTTYFRHLRSRSGIDLEPDLWNVSY